jgi:hypothetical protein
LFACGAGRLEQYAAARDARRPHSCSTCSRMKRATARSQAEFMISAMRFASALASRGALGTLAR